MTLPIYLGYDKPILKRGGKHNLKPKQLNIEISPELYKKLSVHCINNDVKKKDLVSNLIEDFLETKEGNK